MRILIFGSQYKNDSIQKMDVVFNALMELEADILIEEKFYQYLEMETSVTVLPKKLITNNDFDGDIALSIGGDGTFLRTAQKIGRKNIPILGINMGRLGFLAEANSNHLETIIDQIISKKYTIEERTVLQVKPSVEIKDFDAYAINEVAILKQDQSSMISIETYVNGEELHTYQADGLIVATPAGSTAYALSVGGPIVVPNTHNLVLAPVASHSLTVRPLIIPDNWEIDLSISSRSHSYLVAVDGRSKLLPQTTKLVVSKADYTIKIIKLEGITFFKTLKNKLMWGLDIRN